MKILLILLVFTMMPAVTLFAQSASPVEGASLSPAADWHDYSMGLYHKSRKEYNTAIGYFEKALGSGREMHRVYFQIAGCHFHKNEFEKANRFARLAIEKDDSFVKPYLLSYSAYMRLRDYGGAAGILESLVKKDPDSVNAHYTLGNLYYNKLKDQEKALGHFERIIDLSKEQTVEEYYREYSHYYAGYIYYRKGDHEKSIDHFKTVVEYNRANSSAYQILAGLLMDYHRIDEAKKYCESYLENFDDDPRIHGYLGRIHYLRDDLRALPHLRKASEKMNQEGLLARSLLLELQHRDDENHEILKFIIRKYPRYISPHVALGNIYARRKETEKAMAEYFTSGILFHNVGLYDESLRMLLKVLSMRDNIPEVYTYLGKIYEEKDMFDMAVLNYLKSNELKANSKVLVHVGYLYSQRNKYTEAIKYYDDAIRLEPAYSQSYFLKGLTYTYTEQFRQAEINMKKAIRLKEDDLYYFYLATVQEKQNKITQTIDSLKRAIRLNPGNSRAYNYLGYLFADRNMNLDESVKLVEKALELEPGNGAYMDSLGWAFYRQGRYREALEKLLEAEKKLDREGAPDPVVYDHIGDAYLMTGSRDDAINYWKKSFRLKNSPELQRKIESHGGGRIK